MPGKLYQHNQIRTNANNSKKQINGFGEEGIKYSSMYSITTRCYSHAVFSDLWPCT